MNETGTLNMKSDAFFHSVQSSDLARRRKDGTFSSHVRFEKFLFETYQLPAKPTLESFSDELRSICVELKNMVPQLRKQTPIDLETISHFSLAFSTLLFDFETLLKHYTGLGLPLLPASDVDVSEQYPYLRLAIAKHMLQKEESILPLLPAPEALHALIQKYFEKSDIDPKTQEMGLLGEVWGLFSLMIQENFPDHADALCSYLFWRYQTKPQPKPVDWRVRPPVGDLYYQTFGLERYPRRDHRKDSKKGDGPNSKGREGFKGRDKSPERQREPIPHVKSPDLEVQHTLELPSEAPPVHLLEGVAPSSENSSKSVTFGLRQKENASRSSDASQRGPQDRKPFGRDSSPRPSRDESSSTESIEDALKQVHLAVERLKKEKGLQELALPPVNSFLRRHQHALATELGLHTESRGEGKLRTIYLKLNG